MNGKEISIKKAMEHIEVPVDRLDGIIEEAFLATPAPKAKKNWRKWTLPLAAAAVLAIGISAATLTASPALANYMAQLPVIGNVFSIFAEGEHGLDVYERFSEDVGLTETSNGITISIEQAVYDGTKVTFTYKVTSDSELDGSAHLTGFPTLLEAEGASGGGEWEPVEGGIAGIAEITHLDEDAEQVNVLWEPTSLYTEKAGEIQGDWKFEFAVEQLEKESISLDEKVSASGVTVHFTDLTFTEVSVNIAYQQLVEPSLLEEYLYVEAELVAQDDLGNVYKVPYNGGGTPENARTAEDFEWTATVRGLAPEASTLTFYPFAHVSYPMIAGLPDSKRVDFDALEFNLKDGTHRIVRDPKVPEVPLPE